MGVLYRGVPHVLKYKPHVLTICYYLSIVDTAFRNCDISRSGKLLPLEFEYWLKRNPKMLDYLLPSMEDPEETDTPPTLLPLLFVPDNNDDTPHPLNDSVMAEDLSSVQLENDDVVINMEGMIGEENEESVVNEESIINEESVAIEEGVVRDEDQVIETTDELQETDVIEGDDEGTVEEPPVSGTTEPPPSPTPSEDEQRPHTSSEDTSQDGGRPPEGRNPPLKPLIMPTPSHPTDETIRLATALSESLVSPVTEDAPSLVPSDESVSVKVSDRILCAWLPSPGVEAMLASGRKVAPEYLTQPGLKYQTLEVCTLVKYYS